MPAERVHVVTVPQGPDQDAVLWSRFARTVGIEPGRLRVGADHGRRLDALAATEAARLLNVATPAPAAPRPARHRATGPARRSWTATRPGWATRASGFVEALADGGYDVVGDVTELRPDPCTWTTDRARMHPGAEDVVRAQTALLACLLAGG